MRHTKEIRAIKNGTLQCKKQCATRSLPLQYIPFNYTRKANIIFSKHKHFIKKRCGLTWSFRFQKTEAKNKNYIFPLLKKRAHFPTLHNSVVNFRAIFYAQPWFWRLFNAKNSVFCLRERNCVVFGSKVFNTF